MPVISREPSRGGGDRRRPGRPVDELAPAAARVDHVVLERDRVGHEWRERRWDSFCLVTPNWQCQLPGFPYDRRTTRTGSWSGREIVDYLEEYAAIFDPPLAEGVEVTRSPAAADGTFELATTAGRLTADQVVVATGPYHMPDRPAAGRAAAGRRSTSCTPRSTATRRSCRRARCWSSAPGSPAARSPRTCTSPGARCTWPSAARRGWPAATGAGTSLAWLDEMGYYAKADRRVRRRREAVRLRANHYVTGRDGGRDIDLRAFARRRHAAVRPADGHRRRAAAASPPTWPPTSTTPTRCRSRSRTRSTRTSTPAGSTRRPRRATPRCGAGRPARPAATWRGPGVTAVIWCTGFRRDYRWVDVPVFDGRGYPTHDRGRDQLPGPVLPRPAVAVHLGLGPVRRRGPGRRNTWPTGIDAAPRSRFGDDVRGMAGSPAETYPDRESIPRTAAPEPPPDGLRRASASGGAAGVPVLRRAAGAARTSAPGRPSPSCSPTSTARAPSGR